MLIARWVKMDFSLETRPLTGLSDQVDHLGFNRFDVQARISLGRIAMAPDVQIGRRQRMPPCVTVITALLALPDLS